MLTIYAIKQIKKLRALATVTPSMTLEKKKIFMNSFFNAQFNHYPLIWMLHSRKIKHLHERCLRLIFSDKIHLMKICYKKIAQSLYTIKVFKH